ncbi:calcium-binding protein [Falsiroseomonas sp. HW251]|uniref:calcium-binding protein n=1 Tax=Falsiroseomonas sp. HW251 TaxID=3390998 RepID=UPI003D320208
MSYTMKFLTAGNDSFADGNAGKVWWVYGGAGNDTVNTNDGGADTVDGGGNADLLTGDLHDVLIGGGGMDTLQGGGQMLGGAGDDTYFVHIDANSNPLWQRVGEAANAGIDTIRLSSWTTQSFSIPVNIENLTVEGTLNNMGLWIVGTDVANQVAGGAGGDTIEGNGGNDHLRGEEGNDFLLGGDGQDQIYGGAGADTMSGGAGNDTLDGDMYEVGAGADVMRGGAGNDSYIVAQGDVVVELAGEGYDKVKTSVANYTMTDFVEELQYVGAAPATIAGSAQANTINLDYATGSSSVFGAAGADTITTYSGNDTVDGGTGGDRISTGQGNDKVTGGDGYDWIDGGDGNNTLDGQWGNDTLIAGTGNDSLSGGTANDFMSGGIGADTLLGQDGLDRLSGGRHNDMLRGGEGADTVYGDTWGTDLDAPGDIGNDTLFGENGNDMLHGGGGNDLLIGGAGADTMNGGEGYDFFIYQSVLHSSLYASDVIEGFQTSQDVINLTAIDADGGYGTRNSFAYVGDAPQGIAGQLWITYDAGNSYIFGDVNGDGTAEMRIAVMGATVTDANILL